MVINIDEPSQLQPEACELQLHPFPDGKAYAGQYRRSIEPALNARCPVSLSRLCEKGGGNICRKYYRHHHERRFGSPLKLYAS